MTGTTDGKMPPRSRLEINFLRVFHTTQQMASGVKTKDWTYDKQVEWLEKTLPEMEKSPCAPNSDTLKGYKRQVQLLRVVLDASRQSHETEDSPILLAGGTVTGPESSSSSDSVGALTQQIHHRTKAHVTARLRRQLLGDGGGEDTEAVSSLGEDCFEERLATDEQRRERLLDNMLIMTQQLKEQSKVVGKIAKQDVETLTQSCSLADGNQERLQTEADRLNTFNKRACNCWIWLMLLIVCCAFISMVLFIKLFPKRRVEIT